MDVDDVIIDMTNAFDPEVWGKHYWFFLHTIAFTYPEKPTIVVKRVYYTFFQNLHHMIPNETIAGEFQKMMDVYPITPFLDSTLTLTKWLHFIHNVYNKRLNKPEIAFSTFKKQYFAMYHKRESIEYTTKVLKRVGISVVLIAMISICLYFYNK
jgi:hypothetical protein